MFDLEPSAVGDTPAGKLQSLLAAAIVEEGRARVVKFAAVGFDDQANLAPKEICLETKTSNIEPNVDLRSWQPNLGAHAKEHPLHGAASPLRIRIEFVEEHPKPSHTAPAAAAAEQCTQGGQIDDP